MAAAHLGVLCGVESIGEANDPCIVVTTSTHVSRHELRCERAFRTLIMEIYGASYMEAYNTHLYIYMMPLWTASLVTRSIFVYNGEVSSSKSKDISTILARVVIFINNVVASLAKRVVFLIYLCIGQCNTTSTVDWEA